MIATITLNPSLDEWVAVERLRVGALHRAQSFARYPGGKGINVSRVLHELGERTAAFGFSGGEDGEILRDRLSALRIAHEFVEVPGTTRNNYKISTRYPRAVTEINGVGPHIPPGAVRRLLQHVEASRPRPSCAVVAGSLPPGLAAGTYAAMIRRLRTLQIPCALDASGDALRRGISARPWMIKPNRQEAEELLGVRLATRSRVVKAAISLVHRGVSFAIISLGPEGAILASDEPRMVWFGKGPTVRVDSSVGAGDSLVAGFVMGWARRHSAVEAFRLGLACATATVMTPGTELCHRRDVARLQPRVILERLA